MTKPIVSVAAMTLVERGKLFWGEPVSEYLPQFADMKVAVETRDSRTGAATLVLEPASTPVTVQDVLRHTAGMVNPGLQPITPVRKRYIDAGVNDEDQTLAERVDKIARMPLAHHPGTVWDYSQGVDVTGRLIEVISGMSLDRLSLKTRPGRCTWLTPAITCPRTAGTASRSPWQTRRLASCPTSPMCDTRQNCSVATAAWPAPPPITSGSLKCS